jgi:hypothetical protein
MSDQENYKCDNFANESAKTQREWRSGGTQYRELKMIQDDTRRGKVGEIATKKFLEQEPFNIKDIKLDFDIYPRGKWDEQDFAIGDKIVSIKSIKWFSNWLLLETKDILRGDLYDYYILVKISKDYKSGTILGFAKKDEIIQPNPKTHQLQKGEYIPGTTTILDASNYCRHSNDLHNSLEEWKMLAIGE